MTGVLDRAQRRHTVLGFPLAVLYKYLDDQGGYLAALMAYYAFVSIFPLLLLLTTVAGIVLAGNPQWQQWVLDSVLSEFPVIGDQLSDPGQISGGAIGVTVGVLGAAYGALGVGQALQNAMDTVWAVPRNERLDPVRSRGRSVVIICTAGLALFSATVITSLATGLLGPLAGVASLAVSLAVNTLAFVAAFRLSTRRAVSGREVLPGAVAAAVVWQLLQSFGAIYVNQVVKSASVTNSVFAVVLGMLAFLYLGSVAIVLCAEVNAVRADKLYPRALLTPFTDNVALTGGDERVYTAQAQAQKAKGFQEVDVRFVQEENQGGAT